MISKSKLGAIAFIAAIGLASALTTPTFAANYGAQNYAPSQSGGGSAGYNHNLSTDYRLKHHARSHNHSQ
jgi:hypothetical protein